MIRLLPALLVLLSGCTRFGFGEPEAVEGGVPDVVPHIDAASGADVATVDMDKVQDIVAPTVDVSPDAAAQSYAGSLQNTGTGPVFRLLFGMADNKFPPLPPAFIKELELNASTNAVVDRGSVATNPGPLKALDLDAKGRLLLAHYRPAPFTLDIVEITPAPKLSGSLALSHAADPGRAVENTHSLCFLPGGNFVVGDGSNADDNHFNEYDPAGNLVRGVLTSKLSSGKGTVISCCISRSDLELYAHESEIDAYNGRMLRFTRPDPGASWTLTDTVEVADIAAKVGATTTRSWAFALDQKNDQVYIAPFGAASTSSIKQLIRCPSRGYSATSCSLVGDVLPGAGGAVFKSLVQIPGTDDLLALTHSESAGVTGGRKLLRFDGKSGKWATLFDLDTISGGYAQPQGYPVLR